MALVASRYGVEVTRILALEDNGNRLLPCRTGPPAALTAGKNRSAGGRAQASLWGLFLSSGALWFTGQPIVDRAQADNLPHKGAEFCW
jgi:hypothetical protein